MAAVICDLEINAPGEIGGCRNATNLKVLAGQIAFIHLPYAYIQTIKAISYT
jgi:hypothetical protein